MFPSDGHGGPNINLLTTTTSNNNAGQATWGQGAYIEARERIDWTQSTPSGSSTMGGFQWQNSTPCVMDFQPGELFPDAPGNADGGTLWWCPETGTGFSYHATDPSFIAQFPSWLVTQIHVYGGLRTTNGSNSYIQCPYVDNTLVVDTNLDYASNPHWNGCQEVYPGSAGGNPNVAGARSFGWMGMVNNASTDYTCNPCSYYIEWIRVWTCSTGSTSQCSGATQTGTTHSGAVAYWH